MSIYNQKKPNIMMFKISLAIVCVIGLARSMSPLPKTHHKTTSMLTTQLVHRLVLDP